MAASVHRFITKPNSRLSLIQTYRPRFDPTPPLHNVSPFPLCPGGHVIVFLQQPVRNESSSGAEGASAAAAVAAGVDYLRFPAGAEGDEDRPPAASTDSIFKQLIPRKACTVASVAAVAVALLALLIAVVIVPAVWPADPEAAAPVRTAAVVNIAAAIGAAIATGLAPVGGALSRM